MPDLTPSEQRFEQVLATRSALVADLARKVRALVRETLPDAIEVPNHGQDGVGFGVNQYGHDGWGVGVIGVAKNWVTLGLMRGAALPDPFGIVEGTGRSVRHVKVRSAQEFDERRDALVGLLRAATGVVAPPVVQGAFDLGVIDEPTRHSALSAERSQSARRAADARAASAAAIQPPMPEPATKKPTTKKPVTKKPATKKPATKKPTTKKPATKKPTTKKPATKKPAAKKPAAKKPAAKKPATKKPAAKKPATKKPATKKPAAKKPTTR